MADEIDEYLIDKLRESIKQEAKFQDLKTILEPSTSSTVPKISREKLYNLNNLLSESPYSKGCLSFLQKSTRSLEKLIADLKADSSNGGDTNHHQIPSSSSSIPGKEIEAYRWSSRLVDENKVHGLKDREIFLRRMIVPGGNDDSGFRALGLVGMRGIGKTTLAQMVFKQGEVRNHFLVRIWVCVSKQPGDDIDLRKEIVKRLLRCLGIDEEIIEFADKEHKLKGLLYALRQQLQGKRYLIVLDDVWCSEAVPKDYLDFVSFVSCLDKNIGTCEEKLAYGLPKEYGGSVIVTSRSKEIAEEMVGKENLHKVLPLSNEDCWEIFVNAVVEDKNKLSDDLKSLKDKISAKCSGLPLAAKMMGEIVRKVQKQPDGVGGEKIID